MVTHEFPDSLLEVVFCFLLALIVNANRIPHKFAKLLELKMSHGPYCSIFRRDRGALSPFRYLM